jgi:ribosomal protein L25, Ctc-form
MEKFTLNVQKREGKTPNQLRRDGIVPGTVYGPGFDSENVQFDAREFSRLPADAFSHLVELDMKDGKPVAVIIRSVQRVSTTGHVLNVEFYRVNMQKKLTVEVPIKFVGSSGAAVMGAQIIESENTVEIECFPGDIPDYIECNIDPLAEIDDSIHFSDLKISDKIKILNPLDGIIIKAVAPRAADEEKKETAAEGAAAPAAVEAKKED